MNSKSSKSIAVYSGVIPSTTFIERLIEGLSEAEETVLLFGIIGKKWVYKPSVRVIAYKNNRISKLFHFIHYWLLLVLFKRKKLKKLDHILQSNQRFSWNDRLKAYPVLWYNPTVFHLQWAKGLDDWMWVQQFDMKLVLSLRGAHINYSPIANLNLAKSYKLNFPNVDAFHGVSKAIGNEAMLYRAKPERIKLVYSGLALPTIPISTKRDTQGHKIISVGRSHWIKGYRYALDACLILKEKGLNFHYTIIGGQADIELLYQIDDLQLKDYVTLKSNSPINEVLQEVSDSDILLLPSLKEGVANVVLEAMALGTITLSTNSGGMSEVILDGINGFLSSIRQPQQIAEKIEMILSLEQSKKESIIQAAQDRMKSHHSNQQMIAEMQSLYNFALEN